MARFSFFACFWRLAAVGAVWLAWGVLGTLATASPARATTAERGALLYLGLAGGLPSCVACHGADPLANRNRLLNAARGPAAIDEAIRKAAAMGYLQGVLTPDDKLAVSAYLARVAALDGADLALWPRTIEFGRVGQGAAVAAQAVRVLNQGSVPVALAPQLVDANGLQLAHDCPAQLAPGRSCGAQLSLDSGSTGPVAGVLRWQGTAEAAPQVVGVAGAVLPRSEGVLMLDGPAVLGLSGAPGQVAERELALVNAGLQALTLGAPALTGPGAASFSLEGSGCFTGQVLAPGARCALQLRAVMPTGGEREALLQWRTDGAALAPLALSARALPETGPPPSSPAPPPSPPPTGSPVGQPLPPPLTPLTPPAAAPSSAGGGCAVALDPRAFDPLLPLTLAMALFALARRRQSARCTDSLTRKCHAPFTQAS